MNKTAYSLLLMVLLAALSCPAFSAENRVGSAVKAKIGKIDLALATSLHPEMALFDFQKMAFLKVPLGLSYEKFTAEIDRMKRNGPDDSLKVQIDEIDRQMNINSARIREIINAQKTNNPQRMSPDAGSEYLNVQKELTELDWRKEELKSALQNPELTAPSETRRILGEIEKEILSVVKEIAEADDYDIILNVSVPAPFGYPVKYHTGARYSTGPAGIDHTLFYGFLAEKRGKFEDYNDTEEYLRKWISATGRPEALEMMPLQPHPIVLQGGESILLKVLERLYGVRKLDGGVFEHLKQILQKLNLQ